MEVATASVDPEQQLRPHTEEDEPTDPEVVWALQMLENLIAHFISQKPAAQTCESRDTRGVRNETADNPEFICSTAKVDSFHDSNEYQDTREGSSLQKFTPQRDVGGTGSSQLTAPSVEVSTGAAVANGKENGTKLSLNTGDFDRAERVGFDEIIAVPEDQQSIPLPRSNSRGFRVFRFRKSTEDKEKKYLPKGMTKLWLLNFKTRFM